MLNFVWVERAGPAATPPERTGFGTELLNRMSRVLGGACEFMFDAEGLTAKISMASLYLLDDH